MRVLESWNAFKHSYKKRKDSLQTQTKPAVFPLKLEFRNLLQPSLREPAWDINKKVRGTIKLFKVKELSSCFVLNLRNSGENCLIFNSYSFRAAPGISFSRIPTKDDKYSINWRNNIFAVINCDAVIKAI